MDINIHDVYKNLYIRIQTSAITFLYTDENFNSKTWFALVQCIWHEKIKSTITLFFTFLTIKVFLSFIFRTISIWRCLLFMDIIIQRDTYNNAHTYIYKYTCVHRIYTRNIFQLQAFSINKMNKVLLKVVCVYNLELCHVNFLVVFFLKFKYLLENELRIFLRHKL